MMDKEFSEKIIKEFSYLLKPPILISNLKNSGKFIFISGVFCVGSLCLNYFMNRNLEKIIHQTYENKKIDKINSKIDKIKRSIQKIQLYNQDKNELLLSLLQMNDSLFSQIRYAVNQMHLIDNSIHEISDKLKNIQPKLENIINNTSVIDDNCFAYLAKDSENEHEKTENLNIDDSSNNTDNSNIYDNPNIYHTPNIDDAPSIYNNPNIHQDIQVNDEGNAKDNYFDQMTNSSILGSPSSSSSGSYGNFDILSF